MGILAVVFQEKVVADLKLELTDKLKKEYGLTSALTAAVDLAQTRVTIELSPGNHLYFAFTSSLSAAALKDPAITPLHFGSCNIWEDQKQPSAKLAASFST